jgi:hypothetical protein
MLGPRAARAAPRRAAGGGRAPGVGGELRRTAHGAGGAARGRRALLFARPAPRAAPPPGARLRRPGAPRRGRSSHYVACVFGRKGSVKARDLGLGMVVGKGSAKERRRPATPLASRARARGPARGAARESRGGARRGRRGGPPRRAGRIRAPRRAAGDWRAAAARAARRRPCACVACGSRGVCRDFAGGDGSEQGEGPFPERARGRLATRRCVQGRGAIALAGAGCWEGGQIPG